MATISTQDRNALIALVVGMFNAAPGSGYLGSLVVQVETGRNRTDIVALLAARTEFSQVYSPTLTDAQFAAQLTASLLGTEVSAATRQWANAWAQAQLQSGTARATLIADAVQALLTSNHSDFANARKMLLNKIEVASYYSVNQLFSSTSLADLQKVIAAVTSDNGSVSKAQFDVNLPLYDPASRLWTLSSGIDAISGGNASFINDAIVAPTANLLSTGDSIDGGAGLDVLRVIDTGTINIPAGITLTNVESVVLTANDDITANTSNWNGVTQLDVRSVAGDVRLEAASTTSVNVIVGGSSITAPITTVNVDISGGSAVAITAYRDVYVSISNARTGMKVGFGQAVNTATFEVSKLVLSSGAILQDYLNAAATGTDTTHSQLKWFHYQGQTFIVEDNSTSTNFVSGNDAMILLVGQLDLTSAVISTVNGVSAMLTLT